MSNHKNEPTVLGVVLMLFFFFGGGGVALLMFFFNFGLVLMQPVFEPLDQDMRYFDSSDTENS